MAGVYMCMYMYVTRISFVCVSYHWPLLAKEIVFAKRFDIFTVVIRRNQPKQDYLAISQFLRHTRMTYRITDAHTHRPLYFPSLPAPRWC